MLLYILLLLINGFSKEYVKVDKPIFIRFKSAYSLWLTKSSFTIQILLYPTFLEGQGEVAFSPLPRRPSCGGGGDKNIKMFVHKHDLWMIPKEHF